MVDRGDGVHWQWGIWGNSVQGVWDTGGYRPHGHWGYRCNNYRGYRVQGVWATWTMGHIGNGGTGIWGTGAMGYRDIEHMGNGAQ